MSGTIGDPSTVLARARELVQSRGAAMNTANLNSAMLALAQERDPNFGPQLAERAVVQGNRNVPRPAARNNAPPSNAPGPQPANTSDPQGPYPPVSANGVPAQLVGPARTGGTMEEVDPETQAVLDLASGRSRTPLAQGSVAPHMTGIDPGRLPPMVSGVAGPDPIAAPDGVPLPDDPVAQTPSAARTGGTMEGGVLPTVAASTASVDDPALVARLQASDPPLRGAMSPLDAVGAAGAGGAALLRSLAGSAIRGGGPGQGLGVTLNPQAAQGNPALYSPYSRMEPGPTIVPPGPSIAGPRPPVVSDRPTIIRGPDRIAGPPAQATLPGPNGPIALNPPPAVPRVGGRVEGSQPRLQTDRGNTGRTQETASQRSRAVSQELRTRAAEEAKKGSGARNNSRANARTRRRSGD